MTDNIEKTIIPPIDKDLIKSELNDERFIKMTNKGSNEIYVLNHHNAPHTMREIGRLREVSFRDAGGGTGDEVDIDDYDTCERCYEQLIVWNPDDEEIIGGYRYITGQRAYNPKSQSYDLSTAHYFDFSEEMKNDYLPYSIELGRSWVQPSYQPSVNPRKGLFALANIWDGLGSLLSLYPENKYFFGKVTMYTSYHQEARDILLAFLKHYFPDKKGLCHPKESLNAPFDSQYFDKYFDKKLDFHQGFRALQKLLKERGEWIPPLINIYMNLSATMLTFGTARNPDFGDVEETGLLVTIADILPEVIDRHT